MNASTRYLARTVDELAAIAVDENDPQAAIYACRQYLDEADAREEDAKLAADAAIEEATADADRLLGKMRGLLEEAAGFYRYAFENDQEVTAADLLDAFSDWRRDVLELLQENPA